MADAPVNPGHVLTDKEAFDYTHITDAQGNPVDFKSTVVTQEDLDRWQAWEDEMADVDPNAEPFPDFIATGEEYEDPNGVSYDANTPGVTANADDDEEEELDDEDEFEEDDEDFDEDDEDEEDEDDLPDAIEEDE